MKKAELIALAEANEIEVEKGATKADIKAALEEFGIDTSKAPARKAESKAERQARLKAR